MKRTDNGRPVQGEIGKFNTADLAAKLSGVSLNSVNKVIAALEAIESAHEVGEFALLDYSATPLALPDRERSEATERAHDYVVKRRAHISDLTWRALKVSRTEA